jgi:hypothetical protein
MLAAVTEDGQLNSGNHENGSGSSTTTGTHQGRSGSSSTIAATSDVARIVQDQISDSIFRELRPHERGREEQPPDDGQWQVLEILNQIFEE